MIRALLVVLTCATTARADVIALPDTKATIDVPKTWKLAETPSVVLGATGPAHETLAITRAQVPNADAWRPKTREKYVDQIEKGIAAKLKGYKRVSRKISETNTVPTLDLEVRREDGATIVMRILLYRTYALSLAIEVPRRASVKDARGVAATFTPPAASGT